MAHIFLELFVNGVLLGGVFALFSIGLTLIFGIMKIVNFAHGEYIMLGMYATFWLFQMAGINPYLSIIVVGPLFFFLGYLSQKIIIQPILKSPNVAQLFTTVGLGIVLQNLALIFWNADPRSIQGLFGGSQGIEIGGIKIQFVELIAFLIAVSMNISLVIFLKYTKLGKSMRATAQDLQAAQLMGVNVNKIYWLAFAISSACVGIAGSVIIPIYPATPTVGISFALIAFVVVILGGITNINGTFIAGIIIGIIDSFSGYFLPSVFKESSFFIVLLMLLWFRPSGLFGRATT
jgi:branched-chain amino acid transport system permease protein